MVGEYISGLTVDGRELRSAVVDENTARAAAGLTLAAGAVAFSYAYFAGNYIPLKVVATLFFVDFLLRVTVGLKHSPMGVIAHGMTRRHAPEWVSAKPKRFAWTLGLTLAATMAVLTNSGVTGLVPRTICLICLTLMWMEAVLGLCLGCEIHAFLVRRGFTTKDPAFEICANGVCAMPAPAASPSGARTEV